MEVGTLKTTTRLDLWTSAVTRLGMVVTSVWERTGFGTEFRVDSVGQKSR